MTTEPTVEQSFHTRVSKARRVALTRLVEAVEKTETIAEQQHGWEDPSYARAMASEWALILLGIEAATR